MTIIEARDVALSFGPTPATFGTGGACGLPHSSRSAAALTAAWSIGFSPARNVST